MSIDTINQTGNYFGFAALQEQQGGSLTPCQGALLIQDGKAYDDFGLELKPRKYGALVGWGRLSCPAAYQLGAYVIPWPTFEQLVRKSGLKCN
jgi:hypothetical protein